LVGWLGTAPAGAAGGAAQHDEPTTVPPSTLGAYQTQGGLPVFGAAIACPGQPGRRLDNIHASAFLESFLADAMFGKDNKGTPPASAPVCKVMIDFLNGSVRQKMEIHYASVGQHAWIQFKGKVWLVGLPRVKPAFEGKLLPVNRSSQPGPQGLLTKLATKIKPPFPVALVSLVAAVILVVGAAGSIVIRRRRTPAAAT
ncbi:MAG: hypothetical protein JWM05_1602, partial [Acidimicrobiales bacterium]|nr:hypothetical protein [Acidimicrobiales bacterium]